MLRFAAAVPLILAQAWAEAWSQKWTFETGSDVFSAPVISPNGSTVFVGSHDGVLRAIGTEKGELKWKYDCMSRMEGDTVISPDGETVFIGSSWGKRLWAVHAESGEVKWGFGVHEAEVSVLPPVVAADSKTVYAATTNGKLYAVDAETADVLWIFEVGGLIYWQMSPVLSADGGTLFFGAEANAYAVHAETGKLKWNFPVNGTASMPMLSADDAVVVFGSSDMLHAIYADSGELKWAQQTGQVYASPTMSVDGKSVFVYDVDGKLHSIDIENGHLRWIFESHAGLTAGRTSPAVSPDGTTVVVGSKQLVAVDAATSSTKWTFDTGFSPEYGVATTPVFSSDGALLFFGADYSLFALSASGKHVPLV